MNKNEQRFYLALGGVAAAVGVWYWMRQRNVTASAPAAAQPTLSPALNVGLMQATGVPTNPAWLFGGAQAFNSQPPVQQAPTSGGLMQQYEPLFGFVGYSSDF